MDNKSTSGGKTPPQLKKFLYSFLPVISLFVFVLVWLVASAAINSEFLLPSPAVVWTEAVKALSSGEFYLSVLTTVGRAVAAFVCAFVLAAALAVLSYGCKIFEKLLYPLILLMRVMPTMSVIFLTIVWFDSSLSPFVTCLFVVLPLTYASCLSALKGVSREVLQMAEIYKFKPLDKITRIYLPLTAQSVYSEAVSTLSFTVKLAVAGEAVAQSTGSLGFLLQSAKANLETGAMFAYSLVAVVAGFLLEAALILLGKAVRRAKYGKD